MALGEFLANYFWGFDEKDVIDGSINWKIAGITTAGVVGGLYMGKTMYALNPTLIGLGIGIVIQRVIGPKLVKMMYQL